MPPPPLRSRIVLQIPRPEFAAPDSSVSGSAAGFRFALRSANSADGNLKRCSDSNKTMATTPSATPTADPPAAATLIAGRPSPSGNGEVAGSRRRRRRSATQRPWHFCLSSPRRSRTALGDDARTRDVYVIPPKSNSCKPCPNRAATRFLRAFTRLPGQHALMPDVFCLLRLPLHSCRK